MACMAVAAERTALAVRRLALSRRAFRRAILARAAASPIWRSRFWATWPRGEEGKRKTLYAGIVRCVAGRAAWLARWTADVWTGWCTRMAGLRGACAAAGG